MLGASEWHAAKWLNPHLNSRMQLLENYMKYSKTFPYATIKIELDREVKKLGRGSTSYKDLRYCVKIIYPGGSQTWFCDSTLKKLFKHIKEEMYI